MGVTGGLESLEKDFEEFQNHHLEGVKFKKAQLKCWSSCKVVNLASLLHTGNVIDEKKAEMLPFLGLLFL